MRPAPLAVPILALAVVCALALQGSLLSRLPLPGGPPNLVLVLVIAVGLTAGGTAGMSGGFAAGLAADLLSDHPVGLLAACFGLAGFVAGIFQTDARRSVGWPLAVVAGVAAATFLLYVGLLGLIDVPTAAGIRDLPAAVGYDVMLTPFVVPVVSAAARRLVRE